MLTNYLNHDPVSHLCWVALLFLSTAVLTPYLYNRPKKPALGIVAISGYVETVDQEGVEEKSSLCTLIAHWKDWKVIELFGEHRAADRRFRLHVTLKL